MSVVERPTYYERQILSAGDLETQLAYSRKALAWHERHQHSWGVVHGLELETSPVGFKLKAGLLVDGTGRQVMAAEDRTFDHQFFDSFNVFAAGDSDDTWFPVFVIGIDQPQRPLPFRRERCGSDGVTRIDESFDVAIQRPGAELLEPEAPPVDSGPGGAQGEQTTGRWPVLIGWVQWDAATKKIKSASSRPEPGKAPRYAGVYADSVAARGGSVTVRTSPAVVAGKPALKLQEAESLLQVGMLNQNGSLSALMTLNDKGDLEVIGKLKGTLAAGSLVAESGVVSDGTTIALPAGVTQQQVDDGEAQIHVIVSPIVDSQAAPDTTALWLATPLDCFVDPARVAHCRLRWLKLDFTAVPDVVDSPAVCSYLIVANIKQK